MGRNGGGSLAPCVCNRTRRCTMGPHIRSITALAARRGMPNPRPAGRQSNRLVRVRYPGGARGASLTRGCPCGDNT